jgi:hypothetical protein
MLDIQVSYRNNQISSNTNVSFLGLKTDNFLTWKDYMCVLIDKLNRSCFAIRSVKSILSVEALKMVYYSYMHSTLNYGIIFWGNSSYGVKVFRIQKRIIRVMTNSARRASCCGSFRKLGILPLQAQYILLISMFITTNGELFKFNFQIHKLNIRSAYDMY